MHRHDSESPVVGTRHLGLYPGWLILPIRPAAAHVPNKTTASGKGITFWLALCLCKLIATACNGSSNNASKDKWPTAILQWPSGEFSAPWRITNPEFGGHAFKCTKFCIGYLTSFATHIAKGVENKFLCQCTRVSDTHYKLAAGRTGSMTPGVPHRCKISSQMVKISGLILLLYKRRSCLLFCRNPGSFDKNNIM